MRMNEKIIKVLSILLCLMLLVQHVPVMTRAAEASDTMTVYFQNNWLWSNVCVYYWTGSENNGWPGQEMQMHGNDGTYDVYKIEVPVDVTGIIVNGIKNDGSGSRDQTPDITSGWYDGICYYMRWDNGNHVGFISTYCEHGSHSVEGSCSECGAAVDHNFDAQGECVCGAECPHTAKTEGVCDTCGKSDAHICTYDNGFCTTVAGETHYAPGELVTVDNYAELDLAENHIGYYAISNAGNLYWFAEQVDNNIGNNYNVVLTKDITINEGTVDASSTGLRQWNPIGFYFAEGGVIKEEISFNGIFDGNYKTISGMYHSGETENGIALFASLKGVLKNATLSNSYLNGAGLVAGLVACNRGTVTGCGNNATIRSGSGGGIVGGNFGTVSNCYNTGRIEGVIAAGVVNLNYTGGTLKNCWSMGTIGSEGGAIIGGIVGIAGGTITNCYTTHVRPWAAETVKPDAPIIANVETKTTAQFESGEVAYLLRIRAAEGTNVWGQDLDNGKPVQTIPTFDGADVYQITADCASTIGYSNTDTDKVSHVSTHVPAVAATCTEEGDMEYWFCVCGKFFAEEACTTELAAEDISTPPTGHNYGPEGTCININNGVVCGHGAGASLTTKAGGTVFFDTLREALDAAKTTVEVDEAVVKVLKDVVNTDEISAVNIEGGVFTLDIGEAKLVGDDYGLSVENATVTITGNTGYIDCLYSLNSNLTIDGATVKVQQSDSTAINVQYCNLTVRSGSVINNKYAGYAILGYGEDCEIIIEGGTISAMGNTGKGIALMGGTTLSVTGGTINAIEDIITMDGLSSLSGVLAGGSFPGGLYVKEDQKVPNLNGALAEGFGYWQQDVQMDVADDAQTIQGDVEVRSNCKHPSISYRTSGYVLSADCDTCSAFSSLELIPQTDEEKIYSGTEKSVTYTGSILGLDTVPVTYAGDRINVGSFTASVAVGGAAVEMPMEILPYELEVKTFVPETKIYDGTITCGINSLTFVSTANGEELILGIDFTAQLTFSNADAGDHDDAVLTAELKNTALANNYILRTNTVTGINHTITPATITVTDVQVENKIYDSTTDATVTCVSITGVVAGDDVKVEAQGAFADKNSGENKTVNLTFTLSGADAGNYVLDVPGTTTASITVKPLEEIMESVQDLAVDDVTSDDKETLEDVKEELEFVLIDEGLSDDDRKEREDTLQDVRDMLERIQDAADAIHTDPIMDTKRITAENVVFEDKENIVAALDDLYSALDLYENNCTDEEREGVHDDVQRLETALAALKQAEDLIKDIEELPNAVDPDTPYRDDILDAKDRYDDMDDHQEELIPEELVQKLNDLLADLKVYLITKGDGQTWSEGDLSFTANGPCELFVELKIDGSTVAASNYTVVSGSTVLTIKESYLETLTAGKHSISFIYPDGEAVGSFTVEIPTNGSAGTGDEAQILFWSSAMVVSLGALAALLAESRKRRSVK